MGDMAEYGHAMQAERKRLHAEWRSKNMEVLALCGIPYRITNNGESVIFRHPDYPEADFFPSTGRWRSSGNTFSGGAEKFLKWMRG